MPSRETTIFRIHMKEALVAAKKGEGELAILYQEVANDVTAKVHARGDNVSALQLEGEINEAFEKIAFKRVKIVKATIENAAKLGPKASKKTMRAVYGEEVARAQVRSSKKALNEAAERIAGRTAVDGKSVSRRLRAVDKQVSSEMAREVERGVRQKKGILGAARQIEKLDPRDVRLPKYLQRVEAAARSGNLDELKGLTGHYTQHVERMLGEHQADGSRIASKFSLRSATQRFLKDVEKTGPAGLDKIVDRYVKDKAAWRANVIARHETVEAYRRSYIEQSKNKPGVIGMQWRLSPTRHPAPDECFVAGTIVATDQGDRPIECIAVGDMVLTHSGEYHRVLRAIRTTPRAGLLRLRFRAGTSRVHEVIATPNHPFATARGWIPAGALRKGDQAFLFDGICEHDHPQRGGNEGTSPSDFPRSGTFACQRSGLEERRAGPRPMARHMGTAGIGAWSTRERNLGSETDDSFSIRHSSVDCLHRCVPERSEHASLQAWSSSRGDACRSWDCLHHARPHHDIDWSNTPYSTVADQREHRTLDTDGRDMPQSNRSDLEFVVESFAHSDGRLVRVGLEASDFLPSNDFTFVYNLEVDAEHTYFANGILVHNCDIYANQNAYKLGPGVYPVDKVPSDPHPLCLCSVTVVLDKHHFRRGQAENDNAVPPLPHDEKSPDALGWLKANDAAAAKILGPTRHALMKQGVNVLDSQGKPLLVRDLLGAQRQKMAVGAPSFAPPAPPKKSAPKPSKPKTKPARRSAVALEAPKPVASAPEQRPVTPRAPEPPPPPPAPPPAPPKTAEVEAPRPTPAPPVALTQAGPLKLTAHAEKEVAERTKFALKRIEKKGVSLRKRARPAVVDQTLKEMDPKLARTQELWTGEDGGGWYAGSHGPIANVGKMVAGDVDAATLKATADVISAEPDDVLRWSRARYGVTQAALKKRIADGSLGADVDADGYVTLYRGIGHDQASALKETRDRGDALVPVKLRSVSSWSHKRKVAEYFAGSKGVVVKSRVHVSRIFGQYEQEKTAMRVGGDVEAEWIVISDDEQLLMHAKDIEDRWPGGVPPAPKGKRR